VFGTFDVHVNGFLKFFNKGEVVLVYLLFIAYKKNYIPNQLFLDNISLHNFGMTLIQTRILVVVCNNWMNSIKINLALN